MKEFEEKVKFKPLFLSKNLRIGVITALMSALTLQEQVAYAQPLTPTSKVTLHAKQETRKDVFKKLEKTSGKLIFYANTLNGLDQSVTIHADERPFVEVLEKLLAGTGNTYTVDGRQVYIKSGKLPTEITQVGSTSLKTQTQDASGVVVNSNGRRLAGVSIFVKGTSTTTTTTDDGTFSLSVPKNSTLIFRHVGYEPTELKAGTNMQVSMHSVDQEIEEVVVTGVTKMDKRLFTGASTKLNAEDAKIDGLPEISRSLEGRVAGVSVQNVSGTFGAAPKIRVRGATSIYGSSKPLWVVDGVIVEDVTEVGSDDLSSGDAITLVSSAIAGLNADDIESFQILKDGSATSIYGARAMAGVIVITTKKGKAGVTRLNYSGEYTTRRIPNYGEFNIMNSQEQMGVYKEMADKGWLNFADSYRARSSGVYGKMYQLMNTYDEKTKTFLLQNTEDQRLDYLRKAEMRNTDWFQELFNANLVHNHSLSLSSGTEKASYYASLSALSDDGWTKQSKVSRYTANLNMTYNILPKLTLNLISSANSRKQRAPGTLSQEVDPVFGEVKREFDINPYSYAMNTSRALDPNEFYIRNYAPFNIIHELDNNFIDVNVTGLKFQGELRWRPITGLELSALAASKYEGSSQEHHTLDDSNQAQAYRAMPDNTVRDNNSFLYLDPNNPYALPITILPEGGIYRRTDLRMRGFDFRTMAAYSKTFDAGHIVNFNMGGEVTAYDREKSWFNGWGMQYSLGEIPFYVYEYFKKSIEAGADYYSLNRTKSRKVGFFAQPTYSYKHKYILTATVRYDGSNRLGSARSSRWLPTWNIGTSWNAHEEPFFEIFNPLMTHLTVRTSYSLTGESGVDFVNNANMVIRSYNPWKPFANGKESGLRIMDFANNNLTYEKKYEFNVGADIGFYENKFNLAVDWYRRNNFDLIGPIYTDGVGAKSLKYGNVAAMKSGGVEFTLNTKNINSDIFKWNSTFTFANNYTNITKLDAITSVMELVKGTGYVKNNFPVRSIFSIPFQGLDAEGLPVFINQDNEEVNSDIDFQQNTNEKLGFLKFEGSADPSTTGSLGNIFTYKNFRLNVFITYSFGNKIRLDQVFKNAYTDLTAMPREFANRWTLPGDEAQTDIPVILNKRLSDGDVYTKIMYNAYNFSTARIADGGFIRMKEISLSYDVPKQWLGKNVNNLSVKVQGTNPFLIYADKKLNGQDPEFFRAGGVAAPVPKQYTFTLRVGI